ncbi:MAG TPA: CoA-transferase [Anaerolineales bacterium]|nr:CoA-transferase [Anaerolineales bacterium]
MNKIVTLREAAAMVPSGCQIAMGGMTLYRRPMAFTRALLQRFRQTGEPHDLTLISFTAGMEGDLLIGAGLVNTVRTCYFGLEIFGFAPMFTHRANAGDLKIIEETELSLAMGLRAQMASVGFMPGRGWIGTDLLSLRPDVRTVVDPYSGEELVAFPAIHPDVSIIHALRADPEGNAQIGDNKCVDEELAVASDLVIVTADEIVPELSKAELVAPFVDVVVPAPLGAAPTSCHPLYPLDAQAVLEYAEKVSDPESLARFLDRWLA